MHLLASNLVDGVGGDDADGLETLWRALLLLLHDITIFPPSYHWLQIRELVIKSLLTLINNLAGISYYHLLNLRCELKSIPVSVDSRISMPQRSRCRRPSVPQVCYTRFRMQGACPNF